jgi:diaminopimelate decarboxylase
MANFPIERFNNVSTPFYYYDINLLKQTLTELKQAANNPQFKVHYAMKANANPELLQHIRQSGLGIDCVSANEMSHAIANGFDAADIVFAGVGKTDREITDAINAGIGCFNVESLPELKNINAIASALGKTAVVAIRVNPNIDAHTHHYITTGLNENKFGIDLRQLDSVVDIANSLPAVKLSGLHFHIGSQVTVTEPFKLLCQKIIELQDHFAKKNIFFKTINVGGGLGIDYDNPDANPIPDFKSYFNTFNENLPLRPDQELHFELGRAVVAQCGSLISRVVYVKEGIEKKFVIIDAGMSDLIRPALYQAHHKIENLTADSAATDIYDVVGPICESSDVFGKDETLPLTHRGDLIALRSAGAYGEVMASRYNLRAFPGCLAQ